MSYLDIFLAVPLLWGLYKGFTKGLIIEAASLVALGLAIWGSIKFHSQLTLWLQEAHDWTSPYLPLLSFALIFLGVLLSVYGVAKLVEKLVDLISLGFLNKLGGAVFGTLKFGLIISVVIFLLEAVNKTVEFIPNQIKTESLLYPHVQKLAPTIIPGLKDKNLEILALPEEFYNEPIAKNE